MTETHALTRDDGYGGETAEMDVEEVVFEDAGDLGISVSVDAEGAVVVSKLLQLRGYAELSCPTLHAGDVLVAIDREPITELSYAAVMAKLRASTQTRPTRLEFLAVDRFDSADGAVAKWQRRQGFAGRDDDPARLHEGEFDVVFAPLQPTGLRFSESYIMTTPLKLAYIETALLAAMGIRAREARYATREALLNALLVRVGDDSVLGAPVDDVMALLYDAESFPKTLWLARTESLQQNYHVVTLRSREQLKWFCFVPTEMMMEVAVVSYAALAVSDDAASDPGRPASPSTTASRRRTRSDGICEHQYLMAINGFPTLRVGASTNFGDDTKDSTEDEGVVAAVNKSLDALLGHERTLRFRDLKAYRREFLAHAPLSPWQRRRRTRTSTSESSASTSPIANTSSSGDTSQALSTTRLAVPSPVATTDERQTAVQLEHKPHSFYQLVKDQGRTVEAMTDTTQDATAGAFQRPPIKRYRGLANCEGVRTFTPVVSEDVKCVVVPDNRHPIGIQLETDMLSGRPVFKSFLRSDGPALQSGRVGVGDRIVAVNGVAIDEIPTDMLVRILHGEESSLLTPPAMLEHSGSRKRGLSDSRRERRVLRLAKGESSQATNGLFGHAKKLLTLSKARLALWKSSQTSRASLVQ